MPTTSTLEIGKQGPTLNPRILAGQKRFDDAKRYSTEIHQLVPGYEAVQQLIAPVASSWVQAKEARVLVVGCGPGRELTSLARENPRWLIDAIDPEPAMAAAALETVHLAGVEGQVSVRCDSLPHAAMDQEYDLVISCLVGHLIPNNGERECYVQDLADPLCPGGVLLLVELLRDHARHMLNVDAHLRWARSVGLTDHRVEVLGDRLNGGFAMLERSQLEYLLHGAGIRGVSEFFRCLTVFGCVGRKERESKSIRGSE